MSINAMPRMILGTTSLRPSGVISRSAGEERERVVAVQDRHLTKDKSAARGLEIRGQISF
jgi:hypothetical protein